MSFALEEYKSLRAEILEHQKRRDSTVSLALTVSAALLAAAVQFENPYIPLFALLLLHAARIQIVHTDNGIQRISAYIRVVFEGEKNRRWETGSYEIRLASAKGTEGIRLMNISPLRSIDLILFFTGLAAVVTSAILINDWPSVHMWVWTVSTLAWSVIWVSYAITIARLRQLKVDEEEAKFWRSFVNPQTQG